MFALSILSVSLLTVMAGAAIAPSLGEIATAFPNESHTAIRLILSLPPLFIIPFSLISGLISSFSNKKNILIIGIIAYAFGGIGAAFADSLFQILCFRAILGAATGIILPLSTSLIADFYQGDERMKMLGYSFSANSLGAIIGNIGSGFLASLNWHYVFFIYSLSVPVLLLVLVHVKGLKPGEKIRLRAHGVDLYVMKWSFYIFLVSFAFYAIVTDLSLMIYDKNIGRSSFSGIIFSLNALSMFIGGLTIKTVRRYLNTMLPFFILALMSAGFFGMAASTSKFPLLCSTFISGISLGWAYPYIINKSIAHATQKTNAIVMAIVLSCSFFGQFVSPIVLGSLRAALHLNSQETFVCISVCMLSLAVVSLRKATAQAVS